MRRRRVFSFLISHFSLFAVGFAALFIPLALYYYELAGRWTLSLFTDYWPRNRFGFRQGLGRGEPGHYFQTFTNHDFFGFLANLRYSAEGLATWWTGNAWLSAVLLGRERTEAGARWRIFSDEALAGNGALAYKWLRATQAAAVV